MIINEGKAIIDYPEDFLKKLSSKLPVFYNPLMKINRDFTILILKVFYEIRGKKLDILDCMAGTGIRSIRILLEIPEVVNKIVLTEISEESIKSIYKNFKLNNLSLDNVEIKKKDCRIEMIENKYDYIDIDPFGSPIGFIEISVDSLRKNGLLGVTATDVSALSGSKKSCLRKYFTKGIKTDFYLEFGIRNLIKYVILEGLKKDFAMIPVFGYYYKHHYRVFFLKSTKAKDRNYLLENIKTFYYCKNCHNKSLSEDICNICGNKMIELGPIYSGKIYDDFFLNKIMQYYEYLDKEEKKIMERIYNCDSKMNVFYYFDLRSLSKFYKKNLPKIEDILKMNNACRTHFTDYGIKCYTYPKI